MRAETDSWLDRLEALPGADVAHERVIDAVNAAREEFGAGASR
jgi:hypothetical protein